MNGRIFAVLALGILGFALVKPESRAGADERQTDSQEDSRQRLESLGKLAPDACEASEKTTSLGTPETEYPLFSRGADMVATALNAMDSNNRSAQDRASEALEKLQAMSAEVNASWPEERRFHFEILNIPPALAVKMTFRTSATYFVFGLPAKEVSGKPNAQWQQVGSDTASLEQDSPRSLVELSPLHRGPSGNARFLAKIAPFGCAGSIGVIYEAWEWDPQGLGSLQQIIGQEGAFGLDDQVPGFEQIGKLSTDGPLITLPYCWFSGIDTWDNPSLCAVDTYDLSGDEVKFQSRLYNRPDLLPIAKVIEYAQRHDYEAVRAYCTSSQPALDLVQNFPPHSLAEDVRVTETGSGRETVEMGYASAYRFDVEQHAGKWFVSAFTIEEDQ